MRRVFLVVALVTAATALAAISAPAGMVIDVDNYDAAIASSYINAAQCAGTSPLRLEWNTRLNATFTGGGNYKLYAANAGPFTTGTNQGFCPEASEPNASPAIVAGIVDTYPATTQVQQRLGLSDSTIVAKAGQSCTEGAIVYLCTHWYDSSATRKGIASGKFVVQVNAPSAPSGVAADSGNGKLRVRFAASTSGATVKQYVAEAYAPGRSPTNTPPDAPDGTGTSTSSPATIEGLTNGTAYTVYVVAYSKGGNASPRSDAATATPQPSGGFWDVYDSTDGVEQGGCASGPGGVASLLAVASLLVLRRRKP